MVVRNACRWSAAGCLPRPDDARHSQRHLGLEDGLLVLHQRDSGGDPGRADHDACNGQLRGGAAEQGLEPADERGRVEGDARATQRTLVGERLC
jgi:hypothetical protein